jgi:3-isopropylmalate/(R)-2-methylmalate dehydratase small subunit
LNEPRYQGAQILLARENFGCGSSREHAPWALHDYGIRALIAPSFADIFYSNCFKNGMLPVVLPTETVAMLFAAMYDTPGYRLCIDLQNQVVCPPEGDAIHFELDSFKRECLLNGLDDIGLTLDRYQVIRSYEAGRRVQEPWLFG